MIMILITPPEILNSAEKIKDNSQAVKITVESVDSVMQALTHSNFEGFRSNELQQTYQQKRDVITQYFQKMSYFADELVLIANRFEKSDKLLGETSKTENSDGEFMEKDLAESDNTSEVFGWRDWSIELLKDEFEVDLGNDPSKDLLIATLEGVGG